MVLKKREKGENYSIQSFSEEKNASKKTYEQEKFAIIMNYTINYAFLCFWS